MPGVKYIAAGYIKDAEKLLSEFLKENSPEFSVFAHFWKKHNFAAVFLGRSSSELQQFTHEIFQLTLKFLLPTDIYHQIGAVYLLYALFRNQIVEPPTRIRIILQQYQHFLELRKLAIKEEYKSLHYIIGHLLENGFDLVANPTLVGPRNSKHGMEMEKKTLQMTCMLKDIKEHSLTLFENNALQEIQELDKTYSDLTKNIPFKNMSHDPSDFDIETHMKALSKLMGVDKDDQEANDESEKEHDNIGQRRAQIKSDAFASKAWFRQLNPTDEDEDEVNERFTRSRAQRIMLKRRSKFAKDSTGNEDDEESDTKEVRIKRRRRPRIPKEKRRMGRPKKGQVLEQMLMEDDGVSEAKKIKGFRKRGPIARSSYLDCYVEQPFSGATAEITMLSSSSEEENVDDPEKVTTHDEDELNIDEPVEDTTLNEENADDLEEALTF